MEVGQTTQAQIRAQQVQTETQIQEISDWIQRAMRDVDGHNQEIERLNGIIQSLEAQINQLTQNTGRRDGEIRALQQERDRLSLGVDIHEQQVRELADMVEMYAGQRQSMRKRVGDLHDLTFKRRRVNTSSGSNGPSSGPGPSGGPGPSNSRSSGLSNGGSNGPPNSGFNGGYSGLSGGSSSTSNGSNGTSNVNMPNAVPTAADYLRYIQQGTKEARIRRRGAPRDTTQGSQLTKWESAFRKTGRQPVAGLTLTGNRQGNLNEWRRWIETLEVNSNRHDPTSNNYRR